MGGGVFLRPRTVMALPPGADWSCPFPDLPSSLLPRRDRIHARHLLEPDARHSFLQQPPGPDLLTTSGVDGVAYLAEGAAALSRVPRPPAVLLIRGAVHRATHQPEIGGLQGAGTVTAPPVLPQKVHLLVVAVVGRDAGAGTRIDALHPAEERRPVVNVVYLALVEEQRVDHLVQNGIYEVFAGSEG